MRSIVHVRITKSILLKIGPIPGLIFFICVFSIQFFAKLIVNNIANDWIRTMDLWYWKRPLYQLRHNHCPYQIEFYFDFLYMSQVYTLQSTLRFTSLIKAFQHVLKTLFWSKWVWKYQKLFKFLKNCKDAIFVFSSIST